MKQILLLIAFLVCSLNVLVGFSSCNSQSIPGADSLQTTVLQSEDSTAYSFLNMHIEMPAGSDTVSSAIRHKMVELMGTYLTHVTAYEEDAVFPPFEGDADDTEAIYAYYRQALLNLFGTLSENDVRDRMQYLKEDTTLSEENRQQLLSDMPRWEYVYRQELIADTSTYVVFHSQDYIYMGGAHGGVSGAGYWTFDRETGQLIEQIIDPSCADSIQSLLIDGLIAYYAESEMIMSREELIEHLLIEGDQIPLPAYQPYPAKDGLVFIYQQYEIASYAEGMPSFVIPFDKIAPFMTPQARKVCGQ